jgi:hypothetical protein
MEEQGGACLPRVVRSLKEIESLRGESESLCELVNQLQERVSNLEMETSKSVKTLSELEVIKRRMDSCSSVFLQADRFKILLRNMDAIYDSGDVPRISSALAELVQSFSNLSSLAEFEGDKALVSRYTERLEAVVRPKMMEAFESHNTQQAQECMKTFQQINRSDQISLIYQRHFNQKVLQLWQTFDPSGNVNTVNIKEASNQGNSISRPSTPATSSNNQTHTLTPLLQTWIDKFFSTLAPIIEQEVKWIPLVFSDAPTLIAKLLIGSMAAISTQFDNQLRKLDIKQLVEVYKATKSFGSQIDPLIVPLGIGLRFQIFQAVFSPFRKYQQQFFALETKWISNHIPGDATGKKDAATLIDAISTHTQSLFDALHTSIDHCIGFTEAVEVESLQKLIPTQIVALLGFASQNLQALQPILSPLSAHAYGTASSSSSQGTSSTTKQTPGIAPGTLASASSLTDSGEWREDLFTLAVNAIKAAVNLKNSLNKLTATFRAKIISQKSTLFSDQSLKDIVQQNIQVPPNLFLYQPQESIKKLAKLFDDLDQPEYEPFAACPKMVNAFISTVQFITFETMFGFIRQQMNGFSKIPNFGKEFTGQGSPAAQSYMKQIVEHFLILPQVMELMEHQSEEQGQDEISFINLPVQPFDVLGRPKYFGLSPSLLIQDPENQEEPSGFSVDWMVLIARETQLLLASCILQLPRLSAFGVQQLEADILHLFSVLSVLELRQEPLLEQILEYCRVPANEFAQLLGDTVDAEHKKVLILIGRSRKILPTSSVPSK